jgi:hypothetical protein
VHVLKVNLQLSLWHPLCLRLSLVLVDSRRSILKISDCFLNTIAKTNFHLILGHLAAITPSLHTPRLSSSALLSFRILPPPRRYCCGTMAQAAIFTNGTKSSAPDSMRASPAVSTPSGGTKRKRANEQKFYAVREGKNPGIYNTWEECLSQVTGHKGASCRLRRLFAIG